MHGPSFASGLLDGFEPWVHRTIAKLPGARRARVLDFIQELRIGGTKTVSIYSYVMAIRTLGDGGVPYEQLTREDLIEWLASLKGMGVKNNGSTGYSDSTLFLIKHRAKRFLRYCHTGSIDSEEKPEVLECIRYGKPRLDFRWELLTPDDIKRMVDTAKDQHDRSLLFVGYESGARAGELLSLRIRDVRFDRYGAVIMVNGKTGPRRIRLVESVPDLQLWINMHPDRENPDAPLWPGRGRGKRSISVKSLFRLVKGVAERAGIKKHVHPHLLRHSRATHLASVLKEAQMREYFGWTKSSHMPALYVHLSGRETDDTILEHYGIKREEKAREDTVLKPVKCPRCKLSNPAGAKFCSGCSMVLDARESQKIDAKVGHVGELQELYNRFMREHAREASDRFFEQPEIKRMLAEIG